MPFFIQPPDTQSARKHTRDTATDKTNTVPVLMEPTFQGGCSQPWLRGTAHDTNERPGCMGLNPEQMQ